VTGPRPTTPRTLRGSLEALLDDLGAAPVRETNSLLTRWAEVVGRDMATHTEPVGIRSGVLVVHADDPAFGQSLEWREAEFVQRLAVVLGDGVVTGLQVRIRPPT
jgi:predicted nucleic acid-binding Zn ribbon protein